VPDCLWVPRKAKVQRFRRVLSSDQAGQRRVSSAATSKQSRRRPRRAPARFGGFESRLVYSSENGPLFAPCRRLPPRLRTTDIPPKPARRRLHSGNYGTRTCCNLSDTESLIPVKSAAENCKRYNPPGTEGDIVRARVGNILGTILFMESQTKE
jgi:hypothetical protein